jgi:pilus assembly protein CpaB
MRMSINLKLVLTAVFFAVLAGASLFFYLQQLEKQQSKKMELRPVVVTSLSIPAETVLNRENVTIRQIPAMSIPPGAFSRMEDVIGKTVKIQLAKGEYLTTSVLIAGQYSSGLASLIPEGKKAMSIVVNGVTGVAGLINPGNKVDLVVSHDEKTTTMLQQITVLAVDHSTIGTASTSVASSTTDVSERKMTITLAVTAEQAQMLALAQDFGIIRLLLNPDQAGPQLVLPLVNRNQIESFGRSGPFSPVTAQDAIATP